VGGGQRAVEKNRLGKGWEKGHVSEQTYKEVQQKEEQQTSSETSPQIIWGMKFTPPVPAFISATPPEVLCFLVWAKPEAKNPA
jgi:hypothetical protein